MMIIIVLNSISAGERLCAWSFPNCGGHVTKVAALDLLGEDLHAKTHRCTESSGITRTMYSPVNCDN